MYQCSRLDTIVRYKTVHPNHNSEKWKYQYMFVCSRGHDNYLEARWEFYGSALMSHHLMSTDPMLSVFIPLEISCRVCFVRDKDLARIQLVFLYYG